MRRLSHLETQDVVVALPRHVLHVADVYAGQARQQAVAVAPAGTPAHLDRIARDPGAHRLRSRSPRRPRLNGTALTQHLGLM